MSLHKLKAQLNLYTTTIHVINSTVVKLSKVTKIGRVYRGVKGLRLPDGSPEPSSGKTTAA